MSWLCKLSTIHCREELKRLARTDATVASFKHYSLQYCIIRFSRIMHAGSCHSKACDQSILFLVGGECWRRRRSSPTRRERSGSRSCDLAHSGSKTAISEPLFSLRGISSVCISALAPGEVRRVEKYPVFCFTCAASVMAYVRPGSEHLDIFEGSRSRTVCIAPTCEGRSSAGDFSYGELRWMLVVLAGITPDRVDLAEGRCAVRAFYK